MERQKSGRRVSRGGTRRLPPHCRAAIAAIFSVVAAPARAQTAMTPASVVTPSKTVTTVNDGPGHQTDPHISGTLVSYTSSVSDTTQIRYFDLASSVDLGIPTTAFDFLSGVSGTRIVFTRVTSATLAIYVFDVTTSGPAIELAPVLNSNRRAASIGADTVAWQDLGFSTGGILTAEIVAYDLVSTVASRLTVDGVVDRNPAVAPDGNVIVWEKCPTSITPCDLWQAVKGSGGWSVSQLTATVDSESFPDTNGTIVVYGSNRVGNPTGADIYWTSVGGGTESQLALAGEQRNPNVSGNLIVFESRDLTDYTPNWDIYAYDLSTAILYRVTHTPTLDETLNGGAVDGSEARVVYSVFELDQNVYAQTFTLLPAAGQYDFTGTGGFQAPVSNPPAVNVVNAGRVVPIKWQLRDGTGAYVADVGVVTGLLVQPIACDSLPSTFDSTVTADTAGSSGLVYDSSANQFVFRWATTKDMAGGCYAFVLGLNDGSQYPVYFRLQ